MMPLNDVILNSLIHRSTNSIVSVCYVITKMYACHTLS
jgi:hypothetical protein